MGRGLQQRLKMRAIENPVVEGMLNLLVTGALLNQRGDAEYARFGLTTSAYNVLRILRGSPDGLPRGEIALRMVNPSPDVTRLIDRLARRGLVRRLRARTGPANFPHADYSEGPGTARARRSCQRRPARSAGVPVVGGRMATVERVLRTYL